MIPAFSPKKALSRKRLRLTSPLLLGLVLCITTASAAPKAVLWDRWLAHNPESTVMIDHSGWTTFLAKYLMPGNDGITRIPYGRVSKSDRVLLDRYVSNLSNIQVSKLSRKEQLAFWVNLYNALTVKVVVDHYPVKSIRDIDISPGLFTDGPWGKKLITVEGTGITLDDIEHRILRPIWKDARIHYAVNCASIGCPNLQPQAFTAENAEGLLTKGAGEYVNHPRGVRFEDTRLMISSIYRWFIEDFGGHDKEVIEHLKLYVNPDLREQLHKADRISDHSYDWALNDTP